MFSSNWVITKCVRVLIWNHLGWIFLLLLVVVALWCNLRWLLCRVHQPVVLSMSICSVMWVQPRFQFSFQGCCSSGITGAALHVSDLSCRFSCVLLTAALKSSIPFVPPPSCCLCSPKVMLPWELSCPPSGDSNHLFNSSWPWVPSLQLLRWCREDSPSRGASPGSFLPPSSRGHPWLASSSRLPSCQHKLFCLYKQPCFKVPLLL